MKTTQFLFTLAVGLTTLTNALAQSRFSLAPTVLAGYRNLNYTGEIADSRLVGSSTGEILSTGLTAHYAFDQHWSASVGLLYNRFKSDDKSESTSSTFPTIGFTRSATYESLQVPVLINYTASTRRLSPYLSAGVLISYDFRATSTGNINGIATTITSHRKLNDPRAVLLQPMIGIGVQYRFTPGVSLIVQPTAAYELGKPSDIYTNFRNYQLGLQTQLKFSF